MVRIYAVQLNMLEGKEHVLRAKIPQDWFLQWEKAHPALTREAARMASLAGVWLLAENGAGGTFSYGENGKPMLTGGAISITHTKRYALCAISDHATPIGLDAEDVDGRLDAKRREAMAERWFSEAEREIANRGELDFYRIWTRKEAYVKMTGVGLCGVRQIDTRAVSCAFFEQQVENTVVTLATAQGEEVQWSV